MTADTITRADEIGRYIQLDSLEMVLHGVALEVLYEEDFMLAELVELLNRLFPSESEYEETVEWQLVQAESCALTARLFGWLASDEGRAYCVRRAAESSVICANMLKHVRASQAADNAG